MKLLFGVLATMTLGFGLVLFSGCSKTSPYAANSLTKSSLAVMKATTTSTAANTSISEIPVIGGKLNIQSAWINIANLQIEENSGNDVEQQGDHNDGNDNESDGGKESNEDAADVMAPGPFSLDISSGQALIGSFDVYPGTFKKVDFIFQSSANKPFLGNTIFISGDYSADTGKVTPFVLKSGFSKQIQTQIAGGGITVAANSKVEINVVFDLAGWFGNVDFPTAQINNGQIQIDVSNNAALLNTFESNLTQYVDVEDATGTK